ncbi:MAG TPA: alpha/beta-type small acid-soluble spore protein [Clostridia bacterium]|nr:alpha/beta-type small acid-soluble spore protein [Clostridia bacterium]
MARNKKSLIPEAQQGLNKFKEETANELGIKNYESADKGSLSSRQNGSIGGEMVKKMIADYENKIK